MKTATKAYIGITIVLMIVIGFLCFNDGVKAGKKVQITVFKTLSPLFLTARSIGADDFSVYKGAKYEMLRVVFKDGVWFQMTSLHPVKIRTNAEDINQTVREIFHRNLSDVTRIVHNHFLKGELPRTFIESGTTYEIVSAEPYVFSKADLEELANLQTLGFVGEWCIWVGDKLIIYSKE